MRLTTKGKSSSSKRKIYNLGKENDNVFASKATMANATYKNAHMNTCAKDVMSHIVKKSMYNETTK